MQEINNLINQVLENYNEFFETGKKNIISGITEEEQETIFIALANIYPNRNIDYYIIKNLIYSLSSVEELEFYNNLQSSNPQVTIQEKFFESVNVIKSVSDKYFNKSYIDIHKEEIQKIEKSIQEKEKSIQKIEKSLQTDENLIQRKQQYIQKTKDLIQTDKKSIQLLLNGIQKNEKSIQEIETFIQKYKASHSPLKEEEYIHEISNNNASQILVEEQEPQFEEEFKYNEVTNQEPNNEVANQEHNSAAKEEEYIHETSNNEEEKEPNNSFDYRQYLRAQQQSQVTQRKFF